MVYLLPFSSVFVPFDFHCFFVCCCFHCSESVLTLRRDLLVAGQVLVLNGQVRTKQPNF